MRIARLAGVAFATALLVSACRGGGEEAYVYAFPMIAAYKAMYHFNVDKSSSRYKGPLHRIESEARVCTPKNTAIVTPNSDTPYSMLQLDLRAEPRSRGSMVTTPSKPSYPMTTFDSTTQTLDGSKYRYEPTFPAGQLPPVRAFLPVTMYDATTQLLVDNPIDRYLVNSPMLPQMRKNGDGSLTIHIQKESPGTEREANWLPAPPGPLYLLMRLYRPEPEALDGSWQLPSVVRAG